MLADHVRYYVGGEAMALLALLRFSSGPCGVCGVCVCESSELNLFS